MGRRPQSVAKACDRWRSRRPLARDGQAAHAAIVPRDAPPENENRPVRANPDQRRWPAPMSGTGRNDADPQRSPIHQPEQIKGDPEMSAKHDPGRSGKPVTVRVATWSARHRWPVFVLWFVFTIGLFATSLAMGGTRTIQGTQRQAPPPNRASPRRRSTHLAAARRTRSSSSSSAARRSGHGSGLPRDRRDIVGLLGGTNDARALPCSPSSSIPTACPPRRGSSPPTARASGSSERSAVTPPRSRRSSTRSVPCSMRPGPPRRLLDPRPQHDPDDRGPQ